MMQHYLDERRSLLKLFFSRTRCRETAEDLVQDIALRLVALTTAEDRTADCVSLSDRSQSLAGPLARRIPGGEAGQGLAGHLHG